jgi:GNAT superfamily N-acetyltransferase
VPADASELVRLRAVMFGEMGLDVSGSLWRARCAEYFTVALSGPDLVGAVVDAPGGGLAATGVAEFVRRIPGPVNPGGHWAYLSSICTDPQWRRRGLARLVLGELLAQAERRGVHRVDLHATPDGRALYEESGFAPKAGGVEMWLAPGWSSGAWPVSGLDLGTAGVHGS